MGQPLEQGLRTCLIATGLARKVGVDDEDAERVFYLSLLRHVGCTAESDLAASFLGDEIAFRSGAITLDFTRPSAMFPYVIRNVGAGQSVVGRARQVGKMLAGAKRFMGAMDAVCETAQVLATRLGFDRVVQRALWQVFEHWDGKGLPGRVGGDDILLPARFVAIAELSRHSAGSRVRTGPLPSSRSVGGVPSRRRSRTASAARPTRSCPPSTNRRSGTTCSPWSLRPVPRSATSSSTSS